ncbi:MAG: DoxX family protein [Tannerellaceae bacterium]|nr:DoxX family protein [Tannerellaceae bacterium]
MKKFFLYLMAAFYVLAGLNHFRTPAFYMQIMPPWLPWHYALVLLSGVAEVIVGILLLIPHTRRLGAWLTILLLLAIFPANIQMAIDYYQAHNPALWIALLRLPLQGVLIWWAWLYTRRGYV